MGRPVLSTYRLQLRGDGFTLADALDVLDYLDDLGVSHVYLSPILTAVSGSTHGYDVTDPTAVSAELGGPDALAALSRAARDRGMGLLVDIVPNHVGVDQPALNPWWWDVLKHGRDSAFADFFDIDWALDPDRRIILPVLGSDDDIEALSVDGDALTLGDLRFPIAPGSGAGSGAEVHDRQHYRLVGWRRNVCGYRRFFSITSLAGLRQEDRKVFDASHVEVKRWFDAGLVDGVRIDHPDGLADPAGYLRWLREITGPQAYIVIEKILAVDEALEPTLPIDGTTGYDVLRETGGLFIDPAEAPRAEAELKAIATTETLASELARLRRAVVSTTGHDHARLPEAITALLTHIHVYRCDYPGLATMMSTAIAETVSDNPELAAPLQVLATALDFTEPATRLQQLCGAVTAKAVEDCLFYRDNRLVSLNEVGGSPLRFGVSAAEFHHSAAVRAQRWPTAMTTLTTHDTKRGEDVRARIGVLSQVPGLFAEMVAGWEQVTPSPAPDSGLFLWQNIFGVWPVDGAVDETLRSRLHGYAEKAMREAQVHTSWNEPDEAFESATHDWLDAVLDGPVAAELTALVARLDRYARDDALGQKLLALTVPGVPDVYQGTELWEDSLVDPDNRRSVDYGARRAALAAGEHPKLQVVRSALRLRRARPVTFLAGGYTPVLATGAAAEHLVVFLRGADVLVAVSRWTVALSESGWQETELALPEGNWIDRLTGVTHSGVLPVSQLLTTFPVALLERVDG